MKLSTKARYAITAMMDLALHENVRPVTLADISACQGISLSYLEQLFARLRKHGLVRGVRGPGGGYRLARPAAEISIAEIVAAINGPEEIAPREDQASLAPEARQERERLQGMWDSLSGRILDFLAHLSLAEFAQVQAEAAGDEGAEQRARDEHGPGEAGGSTEAA